MQISEIDSDIDFLCGSTSATYSPTSKRRNENIAYNSVAALIWSSANGWYYDDSNKTTLPIAKTTLVHNQQDISLPTDAQRVHEVNVKDKAGTWQKLRPFNMHDVDIGPQSYFTGAGMPIYYELLGRSVNFYPAPHSAYVTLASGVAFYVDRDVTEIPLTATTTSPGFAKPFHRILSYAAAIDFVKDNQEKQSLIVLKDRLEKGLINFYAHRGDEIKSTITPKGTRYWRQYT